MIGLMYIRETFGFKIWVMPELDVIGEYAIINLGRRELYLNPCIPEQEIETVTKFIEEELIQQKNA